MIVHTLAFLSIIITKLNSHKTFISRFMLKITKF